MWYGPRVEPAFERDNGRHPSKGEARDRDGQTRNHHDIAPPLSHRGHSQIRGAKHEHQTTASQEESGQGLGRRSAGQR